MDLSSGVKQYSSKEQYLAKQPVSGAKELVNVGEKAGEAASKTPVEKGAHKVELSDKSKEKIKEKSKDLKENVKKNLKKDGSTLKSAAKHLVSDAATSLAKAIPTPLPGIKINSKPGTKDIKPEDIKELKPINKPALMFISGLHLGSISSSDGGMPSMAESIKGEHYSWSDEDKIFENILRRPKEQPIVLVGHSLGGDAAVNIANRLNTLEGGFRRVKLLVTLDSVGFNNDIIPQNVSKNLNFISDDDYFFNDGPNIARNSKLTRVENFLQSDKHTDIDENNDVQFEIITNIQEVLGEHRMAQKTTKFTELFKSMLSKDS